MKRILPPETLGQTASAPPQRPIPGEATLAAPAVGGKASGSAQPAARAAYIFDVEVNCDECGGSGFDPGAIDSWGPDPCPVCRGRKTLRVTRNYLAEAFQIVANTDHSRPIERHHLVAVIQHCREAVSALVSLPEVA